MTCECLSGQRLQDEKLGRKKLGAAMRRKGNYGKGWSIWATLGRIAEGGGTGEVEGTGFIADRGQLPLTRICCVPVSWRNSSLMNWWTWVLLPDLRLGLYHRDRETHLLLNHLSLLFPVSIPSKLRRAFDTTKQPSTSASPFCFASRE